ncbi:hypothetical protein J4462_04495 [Candidatus Pacearchaeota archaeon]|nr:hypothetical protein [Candidatus Pacearchaeota archaeon]
MKNNSTTIKLKKTTKDRLEKIREYEKETYDEILQRTLGILNLCRVSPARAQARLRIMERHKKIKQSFERNEKK